jgi:hypothetical protein
MKIRIRPFAVLDSRYAHHRFKYGHSQTMMAKAARAAEAIKALRV